MKKLLLIRHAKATHESGYTDFERPLTEKGVNGATTMAQHLQEKGIVPQLLVTSPALRTHTTANIFTEILKLNPATIIKEIYEAGDRTLLRLINGLPDEHDFIALVGHNPAVEQMLYTLSGAIKDVPPGTVALIEFDAESWQEVDENTGKLTYYDNPKL
ncbi:histidine phosphatase family protein [Mucilaginibacter terrenus]|uniref:Histidine phosphatase family protein n=1 Tax=Mucilaginibacter terrenus TaxID=2482727 RepID=A0A3E2NX17_9SPHI|nr:histidine phosphatase family protein [Mucilaginibacter terrenus]RFZ85543.1 histidine phosphatase family protein [Mucilaginibacter terrenus]